MKKSSFVALVLGSVSGVLFALGMCMALLPEWDAFVEGVVFGGVGLLLALVTILVWCKMEHKQLPKISGRTVLLGLYVAVAVCVFGIGLCLCLVWQQIVWGTLVGLLGMLLFLFLIPMVKGIR